MWHYLGNSGKDLILSPDAMLDDLPLMATHEVQMLAWNEAVAARNKIGSATGESAFTSRWNAFYATKEQIWDWYYSLGGFWCSVSGVVTKHGDEKSWSARFRVHVFDRYNWDEGKSVQIGPMHVDDTELGALHLKGLAREFVVRGTSRVDVMESSRPGGVTEAPGGGRDKQLASYHDHYADTS